MERADADDLPEDAERQGLGTPATCASILEKLVQMGFVERRGKQLLPTNKSLFFKCKILGIQVSHHKNVYMGYGECAKVRTI